MEGWRGNVTGRRNKKIRSGSRTTGDPLQIEKKIGHNYEHKEHVYVDTDVQHQFNNVYYR